MSLILHPVLSFTILKDPINNLCLPFDYRVVSMTISVMTVLVIPPALLTMWWCPRQWSRPPTWWPPSLSILREPPFAASILLPPPPLSSTDTPKPITRSSTWHSNQKNIKSWRKERIVAALSAPHKKSQPASKKIFQHFLLLHLLYFHTVLAAIFKNDQMNWSWQLWSTSVPERKTPFC